MENKLKISIKYVHTGSSLLRPDLSGIEWFATCIIPYILKKNHYNKCIHTIIDT